jgi:hypothetical protein
MACLEHETCSVVKSACCSSTGPELNSQHLHGDSQSSVITVPGHQMLSSDFPEYACYIHVYIHTCWPNIHKCNLKTFSKKNIMPLCVLNIEKLERTLYRKQGIHYIVHCTYFQL